MTFQIRGTEEIYYSERANGRTEYWYYSEGQRHYVSKAVVDLDCARGAGKIVPVSTGKT